MPVTYTKIYKDGKWQKVESGRIQRFLDLGWSLEGGNSNLEKKSQPKGKKEKISASAEVTSQPVVTEDIEDIEPSQEELDAVPCIACDSEEHSYKDCDEDNWTYSEDDLKPKEEN